MTRLIVKVLKVHDRTHIDVFGYAVAGSKFDTMQTKLSETCDKFKDVHGFSNQAIKETAHNDEIDIAIDLTGYNERLVDTETDASDPSWSSLLSN